MKRIIQNMSLCVLLALVMGACEEDATLVNPDVVHGKSTVAKEEVAETAFLWSTSSPKNGFIIYDYIERNR